MSRCFSALQPILLRAPPALIVPGEYARFSLTSLHIVSRAGNRFCLESTFITSPDADRKRRNRHSCAWCVCNLATSMILKHILRLHTIPGINVCAWHQTGISSPLSETEKYRSSLIILRPSQRRASGYVPVVNWLPI